MSLPSGRSFLGIKLSGRSSSQIAEAIHQRLPSALDLPARGEYTRPMRPRRPYHPYLMLAPTALLLSAFLLYPLLLAFKNSLYSWDLLTEPTYVGLRNYQVLAESGELLGTVARTLGYSAIVVSLSVSLGLGL